MRSNTDIFDASVVIPCHNAGAWVRFALDSVAGQTLPAREIIVVDDDSTDESCSAIEASGLPIKLLRVRFGNAAAARNAGIEAAAGKWIALLDADDVWYPNHLARAAELLANSTDAAFISNHDWIGLRGELINFPEEMRCKLAVSRSGLTVEDFFKLNETGFHFAHSTVLYQRERLLEVGMFDPSQKRRHDIDLWLRMIASQGWTYDNLKQAGYREGTPGSLSKDEMECDYYYLRALAKNIEIIDSPSGRRHLAREAKRAMGIAFVDGTPAHYKNIQELAWRHLEKRVRLFYSFGSLFPPLLRTAMRLRRRLLFSPPHSSSQAGRACATPGLRMAQRHIDNHAG